MQEQEHSLRADLVEGAKGVSALSVRRPVLAIVFNLLIVLAGLAALGGIDVRELPNVDQPVVTIQATYDGASPESIDREVTKVIEGAARARARRGFHLLHQPPGTSRVTVQFAANVDINVAANDLRDAIGRIQRRCPTRSPTSPSSRRTPTPTRSCVSPSPRRPCRSKT